METAVKRVGVRESIDHLTEKYPEYFSIKYQDVIVYEVDSIFVPGKDGVIVTNTVHDTIYFRDSNLDFKFNKNTGKGNYHIPKDTIFKHDTVRVAVASKCPEVFISQNKIKELELKHLKYKQKTTITILVLTFLVVLGIIYLLFKILH